MISLCFVAFLLSIFYFKETGMLSSLLRDKKNVTIFLLDYLVVFGFVSSHHASNDSIHIFFAFRLSTSICVWLIDNIILFYILNDRLKVIFLLWQFSSPLMLNFSAKEHFSF